MLKMPVTDNFRLRIEVATKGDVRCNLQSGSNINEFTQVISLLWGDILMLLISSIHEMHVIASRADVAFVGSR